MEREQETRGKEASNDVPGGASRWRSIIDDPEARPLVSALVDTVSEIERLFTEFLNKQGPTLGRIKALGASRFFRKIIRRMMAAVGLMWQCVGDSIALSLQDNITKRHSQPVSSEIRLRERLFGPTNGYT